MEMQPDIEHVYQAVALMNGQDPVQSTNAAQFLGEFQKSVYAWSISDQILQQARSADACVFAGQAMRQKVLHDFRELPKESYAQLRDSLLSHLSHIEAKLPQKSSTVVTQLAATLADLYLQVPEWNDFITHMLAKLNQNTGSNASVLLSVFKVFPEELQNRHLKIGDNRRKTVEKELAVQTSAVVHYLSRICHDNPADKAIQLKVISCLGSWLLNKECPTDELAQSPLVHYVLQLLQAPECPLDVCEAVCDCITSALYLVEDTRRHYQLAKVLQEGIYGSVGAFHAAETAEDIDKLQALSRVYTELNESLLESVMNEPGTGLGDLRSIDLLLVVAAHHDYSLVEMTFNVWYRLSEFLYQAPDDTFQELKNVFRPYVERYIKSLCKHCRFDADLVGLADDKDDFSEFRSKVSETVKDVTFVLGSVNLLKLMMSELTACTNGTWDETESALFIISSFIHNIAEAEEEVVPVLLNACFSLPPTSHPMLLNTTAQMLGNLQDWLQANQQYLVLSVQWLISLASNEAFLRTLSESLQNICEKGFASLRQFFDPMFAILKHIEAAPRHGQQMENAAQYLLQACTHLINGLPAAEIAAKLELLCAPAIEHLEQITSGAGTAADENSGKENDGDSWARLRTDPVLWVDRVASVFRVLIPWQSQAAYPQQVNGNVSATNLSAELQAPWLELGTRLWRAVSATMDFFRAKGRVVEHCCRAIRFIIRSMGIQSVVFIEELAHQMIGIYVQHQHSCFLYLASIVVDEYGALPHIQPGLIQLLNVLAEHSFVLLRKNNGFRDHPDTVDDLFRLAIRFVQRCPDVFFQESVASTLFEGAIVGLEVDHVDANRSISKFVLETIGQVKAAKRNNYAGPGVIAAEALYEKYGPQLLAHALNAALFKLSSSLKRDMGEIIFQLGQLSKEKQAEWLTSAVAHLPHDTGLSASSTQLKEFCENVVKAQKEYDVINLVRDLSRLYD